MTGTAKQDRRPRTDQELIRQQDRRIETLETSDAVRIGAWTMTTHPDSGALIASNENGGSRELAKLPDSSLDADAVQAPPEQPLVEAYEPPRIQVRRTANMSIANGLVAVPVTYQSTEFSEGTNPIVENLGAGTLTIGEDGVYQITAEFQWQGATAGGGGVCDVVLEIQSGGGGIAQDTRIRVAPITTAQSLSIARPLVKGQVLRVVVYHNATIAINGGALYSTDVSARFNITLVQSVRVSESGRPPDPTPIV